MGVEHTQPEKGRKLVIDIGGGSTELVIGEDFEPLLAESRRMGCVSFAHIFFPDGEINRTNFRRARLAAAQKLETLAWQYRIQGWQYALGASGSIKAAHEVLVAMGEKDGLNHPRAAGDAERTGAAVQELQRPQPAGAVGGASGGVCAGAGHFMRRVRRAGDPRFTPVRRRAARRVLYEMEGRFRHQDIRSRTAKSLAEHYNIDRDQASRVLATTELLYAQWMAQNTKLVNRSWKRC
ncbi:Exopolyphosphatase [Serratia rubidaea]|uniref:Exopolyphosphatase n=1 Tax=Serratia rubidaea TaxID=61652 RepID=A0A4U9HNF2_SERRU|nr:Exopolyphosphatase [Serratia rubidaea]